MNIPITHENLAEIYQRFPAVFTQVAYMLKNEVVKFEQVDSVYMNNVIKSLIARDYTPFVSR